MHPKQCPMVHLFVSCFASYFASYFDVVISRTTSCMRAR